MIRPVVVAHNKFQSRLLMRIAPRDSWGVQPICSSKRLFYLAITTVPLTIVSTPDCGGEGGKRFSLTQGGRLHEGSAPSDKRPCRLIVNRGNYGIVGSINKAADSIKGNSPNADNPTRLKVGTPTNHHPYRSPCIA
jgi:hypothetical protein